MKRYVLNAVVLIALLLTPAERMDIGKLLPVELISVHYKEGTVEIKTDTGNAGVGKNVREAYRNLKESASSEIFLDTADYLVLVGESSELTEELKEYLRPGISVCTGDEGLDLKEAAVFLSAHIPREQLKDGLSTMEMKHLRKDKYGFRLQ